MGVHSFNDLFHHIGHKIVCVAYGSQDSNFSDDAANSRIMAVWNIAIECETCNEVLLDFDHPDAAQEE